MAIHFEMIQNIKGLLVAHRKLGRLEERGLGDEGRARHARRRGEAVKRRHGAWPRRGSSHLAVRDETGGYGCYWMMG